MASSFLNAVSMQMLAWKRRVAVEQRQMSPHRTRPAVVFIARHFRLSIQLGLLAFLPVLAWSQGTYSTNFPLTENPISESGRWINGGSTGLKWANVRTTPGLAFGTQSGSAGYDDSTAVLSGTWGPNQTVQATVAVTSASSASSVFEEVELRLRTTITANSITGYEVNCGISASSNYVQIVRWNGPLGSFTQLDGRAYHCVNGDVLKATISGSTITVYLNGTALYSVTDSTYSSGSPGMGFYLQGTSGVDANYGFSSFSATDGTTSQNFTLSATPSSRTVTPGTSAAYTVSVAPSGGFTGAVALSASGLPTGATATFSPSSITTSGSSTLTVTTTSTTPSASSSLTIKGTSGGVTQTATATLVVASSGGTSSGGATACDVNKDGVANVVDVQVATNNYLSCSTAPFQTFVSQVIGGVLGACSTNTGYHTVALSWGASTTSGVTYNVYRAATSGGYNYAAPLNSAPISGTSFTDCTIALGQTYYYVIRAVDSSGNQSVNSSETVVAVPSS